MQISCERILQNCTFSPLHGSAQFLARSFHVKAQGGETKIQADNTHLQHNVCYSSPWLSFSYVPRLFLLYFAVL